MTKEAVAQTVDARIVQLDIATKKEINGLFDNVAKIIDEIADRTSKSVTNLDERVSKLDQGLDESKQQTKMTKEVGESLQKRCSEQSSELKKAVGVLVEDVEKLRIGTKKQFDDIQFRVNWLDDWTKNLSTRQWHDNVAQHIANYVPAHFNGQLNSLATRVSNLESRGNDSEGASKRRRVANGSPLVMNGAH
jgi:BMFP domain-containing protein YqiC